jgi:hypothetical protein
MRKTATRKAGRGTERFLKRILIIGFIINLLLVTNVHGSYLRLDLIHPSLPAISLVSLRSSASHFLGDLTNNLEANSQRIASRLDISSGSRSSVNPYSYEATFRDDDDPSPPSIGLYVDSTQVQSSNTPNTHGTQTFIVAENSSTTTTSILANPIDQSHFNPISFEASNTKYYVASNGDDSDPGTESQPWRTIQKAANTLAAGDSLIVLPGEYDERVQITTSGSSGAPITYQAQGTVTMKGFTIRADYIIIDGFDITNTDNYWDDGLGIFIQGSYCVLKNNYIYFATRGGIIVFNTSSSNCLIKNNRLYKNAMNGIEVQGRDHLIVGNEIWRTIQYHPKWTNPPSWVDADGIRFHGSGHVIRNNYIHDISYDDTENVNPHIDCFQTYSSSTQEAASNIIFEQNFCEVLTSQTANESGHGFMLADARDIIIRNNIIQAYGGVNTGAGGNSHLTIVNNVFANNLAFQSFYPMGVGLKDCPNTVVKNNIFYDQPFHTISVNGNTSGQEIDYNLAYRSDDQPSRCYVIDYQCVNPAPAHHLWDIDPLFINPAAGDFHLQGGSPAIDAGTALAEVTNDFDGNLRPQGEGYDIGAFEHLTLGPTATPTPSSTPLPPSPTTLPPTTTLEPSASIIPPSTTPEPTDIPTRTPTQASTLTATPSRTPTSTRTLTPSGTPSGTPLVADLNGDGRVDVSDTQLCVNVVLGVETDPVIVARADVNSDGEVNVLDVQEIVNVMLAI